MVDETGTLVTAARQRMSAQWVPNRFIDLLERGEVPKGHLRALAAELYRLVESDRRSFALLASRFPSGPAGDLFLTMAQGESQALRLLLDFASALGMDEARLMAYEPRPLAQAYPAYLTRTALYGTRSDIALALLANAAESGDQYTRVGDALCERYGLDERAVGHFRFFADTPQELLDQATQTLRTGLAEGDDDAEAVRTAWTVHAFEIAFWRALCEGIEGGRASTDHSCAAKGRR
ncbi:thiaminase II/PqqC family protein [Streptomyces sp. NPDC054864]